MAIKILSKVSTSTITSSTPSFTYPPAEAKITYNDVSKPDAGRTENGQMQKLRIGTCVKIELKWKNCPTAIGNYVVDAFKSEYFNVEYYDIVTQTLKTGEFYAGDRGAACYNATLEIWESISVNLIERTPQV